MDSDKASAAVVVTWLANCLDICRRDLSGWAPRQSIMGTEWDRLESFWYDFFALPIWSSRPQPLFTVSIDILTSSE